MGKQHVGYARLRAGVDTILEDRRKRREERDKEKVRRTDSSVADPGDLVFFFYPGILFFYPGIRCFFCPLGWDPVFFLTSGSEIRCLFDPWIRDPGLFGPLNAG
jgi:hypothetical protein